MKKKTIALIAVYAVCAWLTYGYGVVSQQRIDPPEDLWEHRNDQIDGFVYGMFWPIYWATKAAEGLWGRLL